MLGTTVIACASWVIGCGNYDHDFPIYLSCNESQLCFIYIVAFSTRSLGADGCSGTDHSVAAHFFRGARVVNRVGLEKRWIWERLSPKQPVLFNQELLYHLPPSSPPPTCLHKCSQLRKKSIFSSSSSSYNL